MVIHLMCFSYICNVHIRRKRFENETNLAYILSYYSEGRIGYKQPISYCYIKM